jgi:YVTN family beta-propeller protein
MKARRKLWPVFALLALSASRLSGSFINFETAPVHPIALSPDRQLLAVCNLPDGRVQLFDVSSGIPWPLGDVTVGVDPVTVRFRTAHELWVANHISSSVSIVDVAKRQVVATIQTLTGPADIQFGGSPQRAFISCAKVDTVQVFDPGSRQVVTNLSIEGDRPKAMAVSPDGSRIYVAVFESGNASTVLIGDALKDPNGPYGGQFPPPNDGPNLNPPLYLNPNVRAELYTNGMPQGGRSDPRGGDRPQIQISTWPGLSSKQEMHPPE